MNWLQDRLKTSPRTTLIGLFGLLTAVARVILHPGALNDQETLTIVVSSIGLLVAGDDRRVPPPPVQRVVPPADPVGDKTSPLRHQTLPLRKEVPEMADWWDGGQEMPPGGVRPTMAWRRPPPHVAQVSGLAGETTDAEFLAGRALRVCTCSPSMGEECSLCRRERLGP